MIRAKRCRHVAHYRSREHVAGGTTFLDLGNRDLNGRC